MKSWPNNVDLPHEKLEKVESFRIRAGIDHLLIKPSSWRPLTLTFFFHSLRNWDCSIKCRILFNFICIPAPLSLSLSYQRSRNRKSQRYVESKSRACKRTSGCWHISLLNISYTEFYDIRVKYCFNAHSWLPHMRRKGFFDKKKREKNFICTNFFLPFCCVTSGFILSRSQPPKPSRRRFTDDTRCERAEIFYHKLSFDEHSSLCRRHILLLAPTARLNVTRRETKAKKCEKHVSRALFDNKKKILYVYTNTVNGTTIKNVK